MKTTAEKIEVMQAHLRVDRIECRNISEYCWIALTTCPSWDWNRYDYRIATKPAEPVYVPWTLATIPKPLPNIIQKDGERIFAPTVATIAGLGLGVYASVVPYARILADYTTLDGKPCGTLEVK